MGGAYAVALEGQGGLAGARPRGGRERGSAAALVSVVVVVVPSPLVDHDLLLRLEHGPLRVGDGGGRGAAEREEQPRVRAQRGDGGGEQQRVVRGGRRRARRRRREQRGGGGGRSGCGHGCGGGGGGGGAGGGADKREWRDRKEGDEVAARAGVIGWWIGLGLDVDGFARSQGDGSGA